MIYDIFRIGLTLLYTACFVLSAILLLRKAGSIWLTSYVFISASFDISLWFLPKNTYNHYAFAAGMIGIAITLFLYYASILRTFIGYIIYLISFGVLAYFYIQCKMWLPSTIIPEYYIASYYAIMSVVSAYFSWQVIALEKTNHSTKPLWFGFIFLFFFTISTLCHSFTFGASLPKPYQGYLHIVLFTFNILFELGKLFLFTILYRKTIVNG